VRPRWLRAAALGLAIGACGRPGPVGLRPLPVPVAADSARSDSLAPGLVHHHFRSARGPWAIDVLEADRAACWTVASVKAGGQAIGRELTSTLIRAFADTVPALVGGGINADFFSFDPPGIPTGAHLSGGRVITGPSARPVLAFTPAGLPWIGILSATGFVRLAADSFPVAGWNQRRLPGLRLFDRRWGPKTESARSTVEVAVGGQRLRVASVDTTSPGAVIPDDGFVLVADSTTPPGLRDRLLAARVGDPVSYRISLIPFVPAEAVGGFPVLVVDSAVVAGLDSAGGKNFGPVRHPRTAVGIAAGGRRLLLVTVDGRQPPYSDGMTLAELAAVFRSLGATAAINLDGGGSTAMVVRRGVGYALANRPSDPAGERPVGNAVAVIRRCH